MTLELFVVVKDEMEWWSLFCLRRESRVEIVVHCDAMVFYLRGKVDVDVDVFGQRLK